MTRSLARLEVQRRFRERGQSLDGGEAVTQQEHALQAAGFAEQANSTPELVAAALLHDLADDAPDHGIDIAHETAGARWADRSFGPAVVWAARTTRRGEASPVCDRRAVFPTAELLFASVAELPSLLDELVGGSAT